MKSEIRNPKSEVSAHLELAQLRHALARGREHLNRMAAALTVGLEKQHNRMIELQRQLERAAETPPTHRRGTVQIGDYALMRVGDKVLIASAEGEALETSEAKLAALLGDFFYAEF